MTEELDMEPNAETNAQGAPRLLFSLLALSVGLFFATYATPVYAQDAVDPDRCADNAAVHDDGNETNGSDEDSVAVGCGATVRQSESETAAGPWPADLDRNESALFTLEVNATGETLNLIRVDCDKVPMDVVVSCKNYSGIQYLAVEDDDLFEKLSTGQLLTMDEMTALAEVFKEVRPLGDVGEGVNTLRRVPTDFRYDLDTMRTEVRRATAVGSGATVKANGGVAIGNGAQVGTDRETPIYADNYGDDDRVDGELVTYSAGEETGGGGKNAIAIGSGARAMGDGSIAIGNGAMAMEDDQVMIGEHDIGAMADGMVANAAGIARNAAGIARNSGRLDSHDATLADHNDRLMAHGTKIDENRSMINRHTNMIGNNAERIDENRGMINDNTSMIGNNASRINENRGMINTNSGKIDNNAGRINENRGMINANMQMLGTHATMIGNNKMRLDNHATVLMNHDQRLVAHAATLAEHDSRLDTHDQVLAGHAAGINNNAMEIQMLDERVSQVAAASAALSAVPNAPDMDEQFFVGVGVGSHGGESSVAAGVSGRLGANKNIVVNAGIANSGSGTSVRAGVGWSF